jgi:hypothetical protein
MLTVGNFYSIYILPRPRKCHTGLALLVSITQPSFMTKMYQMAQIMHVKIRKLFPELNGGLNHEIIAKNYCVDRDSAVSLCSLPSPLSHC